MINNKGNVSIITINICSFCLLLTILCKAIFIQSYYYYKQELNIDNLYLVENIMIKNVYTNNNDIKHKNQSFSYSTIYKKIDNNDLYLITLKYNKNIYEYSVVYDYECQKILSFTRINTKKII